MRVFFIGCVAFSHTCLQTLLELQSKMQNLHIAGVATKERSSFNADFCDLAPLCKTYQIPYIYVENINAPTTLEFIRSCQADVIYCFGWSALIKHELLSTYPIVGYHPASLPNNRGRHPVIWALALGLKQSASTFFLMDEGADSGAILSQVPFEIGFEDNAQSLCTKIESMAQKQINDFTLEILQRATQIQQTQKLTQTNPESANLQPSNEEYNQNITGGRTQLFAQILSSMATPQDHSVANLWRKRGARDGLIDFRMSALGIYNLIRALSKPYVGAEVVYEGKHYKVWAARIVKVEQPNIESGKILCVDSKGILIKAYDEAVLLTHHEFHPLPKAGEYIYPPP